MVESFECSIICSMPNYTPPHEHLCCCNMHQAPVRMGHLATYKLTDRCAKAVKYSPNLHKAGGENQVSWVF